MSSVVIRKSLPQVIRPSSSELEMKMKMATSSIDLSSFDKGFSAMPATCFLVFEHPIDEPAETIRRALSRALAYYYPIAGRLAPGGVGSDGEARVDCNGEGVVFVEASADCALNEAEFFFNNNNNNNNNNHPSSGAAIAMLPDDLAVHYPHDRCGHADPLLMMQVTVFSCGGFVAGVTWNHAIADGAGMAQFLQAVGELSSGLPAPSVVPTRCHHTSLPGLLPPVIAYAQRSMLGLAPRDFACFDYTIPSCLIDSIKAEFVHGGDHGQPPCTVFEAVTAVLWQCRTRVVMSESDPDAPSLLFIVANVRKHVGAKDGYYGNCVTGQLVVATSGSVANGPIVDVVKMIRRAKEQISKQLKGSDGGGDGGDDMPQASKRQPEDMLRYNYNLLSVSSMRNIGLEDVEVGGRKPVRVMCRGRVPHMTVPSCVVCLPWKGKDGANIVTRCVREEHVEAFLRELARFT